jgi:hypothetical protein
MPRPYRPLALANEFIVMSASRGAEHMKLQKLVYFAYGWWLTGHSDRITTEPPQVWKFGPVFESLYHELRRQIPCPCSTTELVKLRGAGRGLVQFLGFPSSGDPHDLHGPADHVDGALLASGAFRRAASNPLRPDHPNSKGWHNRYHPILAHQRRRPL